MSELIQIVYISRATFEAGPRENGVEPHVARILLKSRQNNPRQGLVGVLFYGDGNFFQCIEGEREAVESLFTRISADSRHKDVRVLSVRNIEVRTFNEWSMKYVPAAREVMMTVKAFGFDHFDPYRFNEDQVAEMLALLQRISDPTLGRLNSAAPPPGEAHDFMGLTYLALAIATLALAVSCINLAMTMEWL
ncbi:BLUF domain-containing protein [Alcanivorax sp. JB21]|uniref:BLUF domain-containing protein n=1 Tax=Alcanivorax limicola TaxID=2874102 RepID=UPI001CBC0E36|nr:BLUF domain-containing protein [Alcanivorax limicola]MBZ2188539.1 BLUF domain-containing protein [Alcanivorax limicola]